jgi:predicted PurR-regulated permease PerM
VNAVIKKLQFVKKHKKAFSILFVVLAFLVGVFKFLTDVVNPIIITSSQSKVQSLSQNAINTAVFEVIKDATIYESLVNIMRNEDGDIVMITSNAIQINALSRDIVENAQKNLNKWGKKE